MSTTQVPAASGTEVRPFRVDVPDEELVDLRRRIGRHHFATWREPEIFTSELRSAFRSLR